MKKMFHKITSMLLVFGMAMGFAAPVFAESGSAEARSQIVSPGGVAYYAADGSAATADDHAVALSKTIEATDQENIFDITLSVDTSLEKDTNITASCDSAVVLTIDMSGSMDDHEMDGKLYVTVAKEKAIAFAEQYAATAAQNVKRMLAVVYFDTDASVKQEWIDVSTKSGLDTAKRAINGLAISSNSNQICTNFDAGVILSKNLFGMSKVSGIPASKCWTVILSDGAPTVTVNSDESTLTSTSKVKSSFWGKQNWVNSEGKTVKYQDAYNGGGWTHPAEVKNALTYLQALKAESNITIIGVGGEMDKKLFYNACYESNNGTRTDDVRNKPKAFEGIVPTITVSKTGDNMTTADWMTALVTHSSIGGTYASAANSNALATAFSNITSTIASTTKDIFSDAWDVVDPMGNNVEFVDFLSNDAATYANGQIDWDLKTAVGTASELGHSWTIKYRVRLTTESDTFDPETVYSTNGTTTFSWQFVENNRFGDEISGNFVIPSVRGYLGTFSFQKVDINGYRLPGAEFALTHSKKCDCGVAFDNTGLYTSTGSYHEFDLIPSGHVYDFEETKVPNGYKAAEDRTVTVAMGEIVADPVFASDASGWYIENEPEQITNLPEQPEKKAEEIDSEVAEFKVSIQVGGKDGTELHDEVIIMIDGSYSGDDEWPAVRPAILKIGEAVLNGTGNTKLTVMTFGMADNMVLAHASSVAELDAKLTDLPGGLLYGRSSTNCEAGFTGVQEYIIDHDDTLNQVHVVYISDGTVNTDETPRVFGDWQTLLKTARYVKTVKDFGQLSLEFALVYGEKQPETFKTVFGADADPDEVYANFLSITDAQLEAWLNGVYAEVFAYSDMSLTAEYPVSDVERAFVKFDKENGTYLQDTFYYLQKNNSVSDSYPSRWSRTPVAASALAANPRVEHLYMVDTNGATSWMNPATSTDSTKNVVGDNVTFTCNAKVDGFTDSMEDILTSLSKTPYNNVVITDYMSKWVDLNDESLRIVDVKTGEAIWTAANGWLIDKEDRPTAIEKPVTVELVDPTDYADGGKDVAGNVNGNIYKLTWYVKDGAMLRSDAYRLEYEVIVDMDEEGFMFNTNYPANGDTYMGYEDWTGKDGQTEIQVPSVYVNRSEDTAVTFRFNAGQAESARFFAVEEDSDVVPCTSASICSDTTAVDVPVIDGGTPAVFVRKGNAAMLWSSKELSDGEVDAIVEKMGENDEDVTIKHGEGKFELTYTEKKGKKAKTNTALYEFEIDDGTESDSKPKPKPNGDKGPGAGMKPGDVQKPNVKPAEKENKHPGKNEPAAKDPVNNQPFAGLSFLEMILFQWYNNWKQ